MTPNIIYLFILLEFVSCATEYGCGRECELHCPYAMANCAGLDLTQTTTPCEFLWRSKRRYTRCDGGQILPNSAVSRNFEIRSGKNRRKAQREVLGSAGYRARKARKTVSNTSQKVNYLIKLQSTVILIDCSYHLPSFVHLRVNAMRAERKPHLEDCQILDIR